MDSSEQDVRKATRDFGLSNRGLDNYLKKDLWEPMEKAFDNPWSPKNPNGVIMMRLAENELMHDEVAKYVRENLSVDPAMHLTYGQGPRGSIRLRKAVAAFFESSFHARQPIHYKQVIVASGVTSAMDSLSWCICNEGEGIMIPQPLYNGFAVDICERTRGQIVAVPFQGLQGYLSFDDAFSPELNVKAFEMAYEAAEKNGTKIRAVLMTNPHNPMGRCYPVETINELAAFCGKRNIHLISNEVYANSVWRSDEAAGHFVPFTSVLSLDLDQHIDPNMVHLVYGASKDFSANGLRVGVFHSRNEGLLKAVGSLSPFCWTPYVIQDIWARMLEDKEYTAQFIAKNHARMTENYKLATSLLDQHNIPYYKGGNAGVFLWIDLRRFLDPASSSTVQEGINPRFKRPGPNGHIFEQRELVIDDLWYKNGVSIARGSSFFTEEWGWFRMTFTVSQEALVEGIRRMIAALSELPREWADQ